MNTQIYGVVSGAQMAAAPSEFKGLVPRDGLPRHLRLQEGDGLSVTVTRQEDDSVTLRTGDGIQFTARHSGPPLAVGQMLELTVTQSTPRALTVEVTERSAVNLRALLDSFGAEPTRENAALARELLQQGAE
ncbi:MAG: hypothetical protein FWG93_07165, partial [Oscillospiraceae bacterium]|nr:hypothetical protein [Oscillospiraceae bacterium]